MSPRAQISVRGLVRSAGSPNTEPMLGREVRMTISVIIPVHNGAQTLATCLDALTASTYPAYECIVVNDGSTDGSSTLAATFPVRVLDLSGGPVGAPYARNRGAEAANGEILLFLDADVAVAPDTLARVAASFTGPSAEAVFGSYDTTPEPGFLSQYKNLSHHFVHQSGREQASTFWTGCGAIRSTTFFAIGGFDEDRRPWTCEDIELGYRLRAAGRAIAFNKDIQVRHLKRWTLRELIRSDVFDRGIPWTLLILQQRAWPDHLNLRRVQQTCAVLVYALLLAVVFLAPLPRLVSLALWGGLFLVAAGCWSDERPHFRMDAWMRGAAVLLGLATTAAPVSQQLAGLLCLPGIVMAGLMLDRAPAAPQWLRRNAVFNAMVVTFLIGLFGVPFLISNRLGIVVSLGVGLIVMVNRRLYGFFMRHRGVGFASAILPFQLLYYLYSVAAFALGVGYYLWRFGPVSAATTRLLPWAAARQTGSSLLSRQREMR